MRGSKLWKGVKNKFLPFMGFSILGLLLTLGLANPIAALGIPVTNLMYLGIALVLYAFFYILPNPGQILSEARESSTAVKWFCSVGNHYENIEAPTNANLKCPTHKEVMTPSKMKTTLSNEHLGLFVMRSSLKITMIILLIIQFSPWGGFNNLLLPTVVMFALYFTLPTRYKTSQPHKILESWFRMFLGFVMAIMLTMFFTPNADVLMQGNLIVSIILLMMVGSAMAFLTIFMQSPAISILVGIVVVIVLSIFLGAIFAPVFAVPSVAFFFLTFAYFATMPVRDVDQDEEVSTKNSIAISLSKVAGDSQDEWDIFGTGLFIGFVLVSMVPVMGSWISGMPVQIFLVFGLLFFFSMFTGAMSRESRPYVGMVVLMFAIFAFSFAYTDTVGTAVFGQYWGSVEATGTMFFTPISEQLNKANCEAFATMQCITEGPVKCSEEKLKCERTKAEAQGSEKAIEFQNFKTDPPVYEVKGTNTIYFELSNNGDYTAKDITLQIPETNGFITRVEGKEIEAPAGTVSLDSDSCIGGNYTGENTCVWNGDMPKGGKGAVIFTVKWDKSIDKSWGGDKGLYPEIKMSASYYYTVHSSYTVDVRSSEELRRLLLAGESLGGTIAQFTGGPITASIWTPKYIESGKATLVTAYLTNTKEGVAKDAAYCLYVPEDSVITDPSSAAHTISDCPEKIGTKSVKCAWGEIKSASSVDSSARPLNSQTCNFRLTLDTAPAAQKQLPITGDANYKYVVSYGKKDVMFAFVSETFV